MACLDSLITKTGLKGDCRGPTEFSTISNRSTHTLVEELSQLLAIVRVGDSASLFPADHGLGGDPDGLGDPGLGPAALFALHFQGMWFHIGSPELLSSCYVVVIVPYLAFWH